MITRLFGHLCVIGVIFFAFGKLDFSILHSGTVLHETTHDVLFFKMKADQEGYVWTNGMSRRSNKVHISSIGTRQKNQQFGCGKIRILSTGSSSAFGSGLRDEDIWSSILNRKFDEASINAEIFNSANPGWGPYHWYNFVELSLDTYNPDLVLIPLSYGDFTFYPVTTDENDRAAWVERDAVKKQILNFDNFVSYSLRKVMYLLQALKQKYDRDQIHNDDPQRVEVDRFSVHYSNQQTYMNSLLDLAREKDFELVFFVRNADATKPGLALFDRLESISASSRRLHVFQIHPSDFRPTLRDEEIQNYYKENLIIKNDGHPNERYSVLMGEKLYRSLEPLIESMGEPKNSCI